jgi:hypothetical protein
MLAPPPAGSRFFKPILSYTQVLNLVIFLQDFETMLMKDTDYIDLNQFPDHAYYNEVSLSGERV